MISCINNQLNIFIMKKVVLSIFGLLAMSLSYGQNTSTVSQTGNSDNAAVTQTGKNKSTISQKTTGGVTTALNNDAEVIQTSVMTGVENRSDIKQNGDGNKAKVVQDGNDNDAKINQGVGYAENNFAYANQKGDGNTSTQKQRYDNNYATVQQNGNGNTAKQEQYSSNNGSASATVATAGANKNKAEIFQGINPSTYLATGNLADQMQDGVGNAGYISQSNMDNKAYQTQVGNGNTATIWQDQIVGGSAILGNDWAKQTQEGNGNTATVDQGSTGNQHPSDVLAGDIPASFVGVSPVGGHPVLDHGFNKAKQSQEGNSNTAYVSQGGYKNKSEQVQIGDGNESYGFQYGDRNRMNSTQDGNGNKEYVLQVGNKNKSTLMQTGNNHMSTVLQNGNSNTSTVTQN
jgi:Curlin associated repeat